MNVVKYSERVHMARIVFPTWCLRWGLKFNCIYFWSLYSYFIIKGWIVLIFFNIVLRWDIHGRSQASVDIQTRDSIHRYKCDNVTLLHLNMIFKTNEMKCKNKRQVSRIILPLFCFLFTQTQKLKKKVV